MSCGTKLATASADGAGNGAQNGQLLQPAPEKAISISVYFFHHWKDRGGRAETQSL